jgi:hypothetical protein
MEETEVIEEMTTDESLLESLSEHKLEELKLEPYSLVRQAVASSLADPGSGILFNAIMTVWVCTLPGDEVLEAHEDIRAAKKRAFAWAEKRGYSLWNWKPLIEAYNKLNREWAAATKARVRQDGEEPEDVPNDGGQPAS